MRAATIGERIAAVLDKARGEAILFEDRWHDWPSLRRTADALATAIANVPLEQSVAQVTRNRPWSVGTLLGLLREGRCILQVSPIQPPAAIAEEMRRLSPAIIVAEADDWSAQLLEAAAELGALGISLSPDGVSRVTARRVWEQANDAPAADKVAIMMPTSGTTGPPKRVPLTLAQLETYRADKDAQVVESDRVVIVAGPLFTVTGLRPMLSWATRPMRMALMERVDVERWAGLVRAYRPRDGGLPPAAMRMLLDSDVPRDSLASLQGWVTGSAPVDPDIAERFEAEFGVPVLVAYGATEFGGPVARMTVEDRQRWGNAKRGSSGRAIAGNSLRVVGREDGRELPSGESGLLEVSAARTGNQWVRTNDLARIDSDGFLFIEGRADDVIIRGGFKVPLGEIEAKLETHPEVAQAAVLAEADDRLGQVPVAAIVPREGTSLDAAAIEQWARETLAPYKRPVRFVILRALPMTASMKVNRPELRRLIGKGV
jgi:acyl-coenzyme A synthetase/AMP-(fatty) acid ligase